MISSPLIRMASLAVVIAVSVTGVSARPHRHVLKARVRFWATSTLVRGTWGQNEDTYLAELRFAHSEEVLLARLVDTYPNESPPLAREILTSDSETVLHVMRAAECDLLFGQMLLRTAPGDPMAILPEWLDYRPTLGPMPDSEAILPCYRVARR